jgi:hypothetical protein
LKKEKSADNKASARHANDICNDIDHIEWIQNKLKSSKTGWPYPWVGRFSKIHETAWFMPVIMRVAGLLAAFDYSGQSATSMILGSMQQQCCFAKTKRRD